MLVTHILNVTRVFTQTWPSAKVLHPHASKPHAFSVP